MKPRVQFYKPYCYSPGVFIIDWFTKDDKHWYMMSEDVPMGKQP